MNTVFCQKLQKEGEALARTPWPGELGQRIVDNICQETWQEWLGQQTILINENNLSPINPEHKAMLQKEMVAFLFGESE